MSRCPEAPRAAALACAALALLSPLLPPPAHADDTPTVVVTAARSAQLLTDAIPHTTVLTRTDIDRSQAVDLVDLLAGEAGVQFSVNGGRGAAAGIFIRGAPTRQVLVLVDGVPLVREDATGQVGIEHLMLDQVERVEIVRGNVSALYGSGAVGGVIQVFTRAGVAPASARFEVGSRGFVLGAAQVSGAAGGTTWTLGVSANRDNGFSALNPAQIPNANPDDDGYSNASASLSLAHRLAPGHELSLQAWHSDGRLDYDSAFATPADLQRSRTRKDLVQVGSRDAISPVWTSELTLSSQRDSAQYEETGAFGFDARYDTRAQVFGWRHTWDLSPLTQLTAGVERQRQAIVADDGFGGAYDRSRPVAAAYAGVQARRGDHELALNLRYDDVGGVGSSPTGRVGWGWSAAPAWKLFASVANAFSAPPLGYLYAPYYGNPALQPERSTSAELGAQWAAGAARARATLFRTRVSDEIDYDPVAMTLVNVARTLNRGVELSYADRIGATDWRASFTAQHPIDADTGERLLRRSDRLASLMLSHDFGRGWRGGASLRYAGDRVDTGGVILAAYTVADATLQWAFAPQWQWLLRVENLGDVHYQTAFGYNQPPRGVFTGLRWRAPS
jgi:vitamin B12 transporter